MITENLVPKYTEFKNQYDIVFSDNGEINCCGRENCKKLISLAQEIGDLEINYGNLKTGVMDIQAIKNLKNGYEKEYNKNLKIAICGTGNNFKETFKIMTENNLKIDI